MSYLEWTDTLSVGVTKIDQEHQQLVKIVNTLYEAVMARKSQEILKPILFEMAKYAASHFCTEETYMDHYGYPAMDAHVQEHQNFVNKIEQFVQQFEAGKLFLTTEIMDFLKNWLINHIQGTDKKYTAFFHQNGLH